MQRTLQYAIVSALILCVTGSLSGQVLNTESPYSRYGFGERVVTSYGRAASMGGITQGLRDPNAVNPFNPAAYTSQDTMSFILDMGMQAGYVTAKSKGYTASNNLAVNIHHLAIQFPLQKWGGVAVGFHPYSQMGYNVVRYETDPQIISKIGRVRYHHKGSGGINEAFLGLALQPLSFLSVGVNGRYLFGSLNQEQNIIVPANATYADVNTTRRIVLRGFVFTAGLQTHFSFGENRNQSLTLGATVDYAPQMNVENRLEMTQSILNGEYRVVDNYLRSRGKITYPMRYAVGGLYHNEHWEVGADFSTQNWRGFALPGGATLRESSYSINAGVQWVPNATDLRNYARRMQYRMGFSYERLPLLLAGHSISDYAVTIGLGFPFRYTGSIFNLGLVFGRRGTPAGNLVQESYARLQLGISLNDVWFFKRRYN